jgi:hypothetical protein
LFSSIKNKELMYTTIVGIVLLIVGIVFGFVWPKKSWHWGLWICSPLIIPVCLSVAFAGNLTAFLKNDLPIILVGLISACCGGFIGARLKKRRI